MNTTTARSAKAAAEITVQVANSYGPAITVDIVVGESITLHGASAAGTRYVKDPVTGRMVPSTRATLFCNHFAIGDVAEVHAYNLVYTGIVRKITAKTVTVVEYEGTSNAKTYRFSIERFASKNWDFDAKDASKRNSEWTD